MAEEKEIIYELWAVELQIVKVKNTRLFWE